MPTFGTTKRVQVLSVCGHNYGIRQEQKKQQNFKCTSVTRILTSPVFYTYAKSPKEYGIPISHSLRELGIPHGIPLGNLVSPAAF